MKIQVVGCSHHNSTVETRERLAFNPDQTHDALARFRERFPGAEAVLLSTCNRVEFYTAAESNSSSPSHQDIVEFIAGYHGITSIDVFDDLFERSGEDAVRHLFTVAASLDSMVVGEAQILSQVKQAYEVATSDDSAGPLTHGVFQAAIRVAKRVASETAINQRRVSIPSVAVADYAKGLFEVFDDKQVLVIGAGEMGDETLTYLIAEGAKQITIVNRSIERAEAIAEKHGAKAAPWSELDSLLIAADLIISTTGATEPIITLADYKRIEHERYQRPLLMLDLAVPRDIDPAVGKCTGVYLVSIDDLSAVCDKNRKSREKEWPKAERIIETETARFMADLNHRATAPTIRRLKTQAEDIKTEELGRLLNKLSDSDEKTRDEITRSFDRLVNKLLHPPLEALRDEAKSGAPDGLMDALKRLFGLKE